MIVSQKVSFEELREQMSIREKTEQKSKPTLTKEKDIDLENFDYRLTKQEYRVFRLLKQSIGKCISRTEMAITCGNLHLQERRKADYLALSSRLRRKWASTA